MKTIIVSVMTYRLRRPALVVVTAALATLGGGLTACGSNQTSGPGSSTAGGAASGTSAASSAAAPVACPSAPVDVVVSVDQWGDIVSELGGACANVKTILASSSVDPHDYEPSPADAASFAGAKMVVVNGADYDAWASKLAATSAAAAPVVSAAEVTKTPDGANPHLWYSPTAVNAVADAVTAELSKIDPQAAGYFSERRTAFTTSLQPYTALIDKIKAGAAGKSYAATEGIFDYQAEAIGLVNKTPEGYQKASANESDPSPADIQAFTAALAGKQIDVLIYNTQTEGSIPQQIRSAAEQAGVPIVDVTETVPPGQTSFEAWQDGQLTALAKALGVTV
jgi:zinc/manganese transport system substrate-binding protein